MSASNYLENALAAHLFQGTQMTAPTALSIALFITLPDEDNAGGAEPAAASYARVAYGPSVAAWSSPAAGDGRVFNNFAVTFPPPLEDWGTILGFGIFDQAGNLLFSDLLSISKDVLTGDPAPEFNPGSLSVIIS